MSRRTTGRVALCLSTLALTLSVGALTLAAGTGPDAAAAPTLDPHPPQAAALAAAQARAEQLHDRVLVVEAALDASDAARRRLEVERDALEARLAGDGALHRRLHVERIDEAHALLPPS
jgi:hypothetical protein